MREGRNRSTRAGAKAIRDALLVLFVLAIAATTSVSIDPGSPARPGPEPAPGAIFAPATHAVEGDSEAEAEDQESVEPCDPGVECLNACLTLSGSAPEGPATHADLIEALESLGIRIVTA